METSHPCRPAQAKVAVEAELRTIEGGASPRSQPRIRQLLLDLNGVVDDLVALRRRLGNIRNGDVSRFFKTLHRAGEVLERLESVLSKHNAEHIAVEVASHLDAHLLATLSDFGLEIAASALTALPPGRIAGDANGVEYVVEDVDLSKVAITPQNLKVVVDKGERCIRVSLAGVKAPLDDLRWKVAKANSQVFRDEGVAFAEVDNICLRLDLIAARRYDGGDPFLAVGEARVSVDSCEVRFDDTSYAWIYNAVAGSIRDLLCDYIEQTVHDYIHDEAAQILSKLNAFIETQALWPLLLKVANLSLDSLPIMDRHSPRTPERRKRVASGDASPKSASRPSPGFREVQATWL